MVAPHSKLDIICKHSTAKKDNEFIYFEKIPSVEELAPVEGAAVVKPSPLPDKFLAGQASLFGDLAALDSTARKAECVGENSILAMVTPYWLGGMNCQPITGQHQLWTALLGRLSVWCLENSRGHLITI